MYEDYRKDKADGLVSVFKENRPVRVSYVDGKPVVEFQDFILLKRKIFSSKDGSKLPDLEQRVYVDELNQLKTKYQSLIADIDELLADIAKLLEEA